MRNFILKTSVFAIFILVILVFVNYYGDSANLFHPGYEKKLASIIFNNKNATNIANYDERILQKELIKNLCCRPDILVLGSSRTMLINSTLFKEGRVMNNSVSSANINDLIAIFQMYKSRNILPKKIILGIDPWYFNENNNQTRWLSLRNEYDNYYNNKIQQETSFILNNFLQLISFSYFQESLTNLRRIISGNSEPIATSEIHNISNTKLLDSSFSYGINFRSSTIKDVNKRVTNYILGSLKEFDDFNEVSISKIIEFEEFCFFILNNNIELSFFLAPYHPEVYDEILKEYPHTLDSENILNFFSKNNNIQVYGSYNPREEGIKKDGFYDALHLTPKSINDIMNIENQFKMKALSNWN